MATIRALESLIAVADTGSLTAAAARLHLSQPALSHQVRVLERETGTAVIDRLPRGVLLTAAGRAMLEPARSAVLAANRAVALGRAVGRGEAGVLRIACAESMTAGLLAPALTTWRSLNPDVIIELTERLSADHLATDVLLGNADLAIGPMPSPVPLELTPLLRESFCVVVAADHPFAGGPDVRIADLAHRPFIHLEAGNGLADWLDAVAAAAGVVLQPVLRVRTAHTVVALAGAGLGVGLVPEDLTHDGDAVSVRLEPPLFRDIVAMHRSPQQPLVEAFCAILRETLRVTASHAAAPPR